MCPQLRLCHCGYSPNEVYFITVIAKMAKCHCRTDRVKRNLQCEMISLRVLAMWDDITVCTDNVKRISACTDNVGRYH